MRNRMANGSNTCGDVPKPRVRRLERCVFALGAVCVLFASMALTAGDDEASRNMAGSGVICASSALGIGDHEWHATPMGPPPELACARVSAPEEWLGSDEQMTKIMMARISCDPLDPRLKLDVQAYPRDKRFSHLWVADANVDSDPLGGDVWNVCNEYMSGSARSVPRCVRKQASAECQGAGQRLSIG